MNVHMCIQCVNILPSQTQYDVSHVVCSHQHSACKIRFCINASYATITKYMACDQMLSDVEL
jgi:hypothetical protein